MKFGGPITCGGGGPGAKCPFSVLKWDVSLLCLYVRFVLSAWPVVLAGFGLLARFAGRVPFILYAYAVPFVWCVAYVRCMVMRMFMHSCACLCTPPARAWPSPLSGMPGMSALAARMAYVCLRVYVRFVRLPGSTSWRHPARAWLCRVMHSYASLALCPFYALWAWGWPCPVSGFPPARGIVT